MTKPSMLVLDLDGTTLRHDGTLAPEDVRAARALQDAGVVVTIATGRLYPGTGWVAKELGIRGTVAVMNGSEHVNAETDENEHQWTVGPEFCRAAVTAMSEFPLHPLLFGSRGIHHGHDALDHAPYLGIWSPTLTAHEDVLATAPWHAEDVLAVSALGEMDDIQKLRERLEPFLEPGMGFVQFDTFTGRRFLEARQHTEDKGTALRRLAAARGKTAADCVAVGDWLNDVPLFKAAGRSFVMGGALPEVSQHADQELTAQKGGGGAIVEVARRVWGI